MPIEPRSDPRFQYRLIKPPTLPVETLDMLAKDVFSPEDAKLGIIGVIFKAAKVAFALAYLAAREKLVKAQQEYDKQLYERMQAGQNQGDLDGDNLSGEKRP